MLKSARAFGGLVILLVALGWAGASAAVQCKHVDTAASSGALYEARPEQLGQGLIHAELANSVYQCDGSCEAFAGESGEWRVLVDSRDVPLAARRQAQGQAQGVGAANSTAPIVLDVPLDPGGFHAAAYVRPDGSEVVIAFEGTRTQEDWQTNAAMVLWTPEQFGEADRFTRTVMQRACGNDGGCLRRVSVTGHSLGGALAQYAGMRNRLDIYTFNGAGLFAPSQVALVMEGQSAFSGLHFFSRGYVTGERAWTDVVPYWGAQFSQDACEVPVTLSTKATGPVTRELETHSMKGLLEALRLALKSQSSANVSCVPAPSGEAEPWDWNSRVLASFPPDAPKPVWLGKFGDRRFYQIDLWQDSKGIFGEFRNPVLEADSPTSRLYDATFNPASGALNFKVRVADADTWFSGTLTNGSVTGILRHSYGTEAVKWRRLQDLIPISDEWPSSRAQFDCAMNLWHRF